MYCVLSSRLRVSRPWHILPHRCQHDVYYKFHHKEPSRKECPKLQVTDSKEYFLLHPGTNQKPNIFLYSHHNTKSTSSAKGLKEEAELVPWGAIIGDPKNVKQFVTGDDVNVYVPYVRSTDLDTKVSDFLVKRLLSQSPKGVESVASILGAIRDVPMHVIGEERQLTAILKNILTRKLGKVSMTVSSGVLTKSELTSSQYVGKPDLCIYGYGFSGAIISPNFGHIDGITMEGKWHEFALDQCIADMIVLGTDLLEINLRKGHMVDTILIYGIAASYYQHQGRLSCLMVDFQKNEGKITYSNEDLPLHFCINATCSLVKR